MVSQDMRKATRRALFPSASSNDRRSRNRLVADRRAGAAVSISLLQFQQLTRPPLKFLNCRLAIVASHDRTRPELMSDNASAPLLWVGNGAAVFSSRRIRLNCSQHSGKGKYKGTEASSERNNPQW